MKASRPHAHGDLIQGNHVHRRLDQSVEHGRHPDTAPAAGDE
jgi:hypothetical protein